jgi:predicted nucleic acid-binding Zn ribbon protein
LQPNLSSALDNLKLLSEKDGKPATVAAKRRVSLWDKVLGHKPAAQQTPPAADATADSSTDAGVNAPVNTTVKK